MRLIKNRVLRNTANLRRPRKKLSTRYSLVVPCHNVEKYLDDFFHSLFSQSVDPECLEIIAVDDGSTDGTAQRIADWAERFPGRIQYIFQHNQRQAAARNTGLAQATGEWVSFPDPDDFFSTNYVEKVDEELARAHSRPLSMVSCNLIFFKEAKCRKHDTHPLRYRFEEDRTILPADDLQDHMQLSVATAWFRRDLIEQHSLRFDSRIFPTFEDGHFVNRFLLLNPNTDVAFLKAPTYYYRKRSDGTSTLDSAKLVAGMVSRLCSAMGILISYVRRRKSRERFRASSSEPSSTTFFGGSTISSITQNAPRA